MTSTYHSGIHALFLIVLEESLGQAQRGNDAPGDLVQDMTKLSVTEPFQGWSFEVRAPYKVFVGEIEDTGERPVYLDILVWSMKANKVLASVSSCGSYINLRYIIPKAFARYDRAKNVPPGAENGYRELVSQIEEAYDNTTEIPSDPPQVIGPLPWPIDQQLRSRSLVLDIPMCMELYEQLYYLGFREVTQIPFQIRMKFIMQHRVKIEEESIAFINRSVFTPPRLPGVAVGPVDMADPPRARRYAARPPPAHLPRDDDDNMSGVSMGSRHIGDIHADDQGSNGSVNALRAIDMPRRREEARARNLLEDPTNNRPGDAGNVSL